VSRSPEALWRLSVGLGLFALLHLQVTDHPFTVHDHLEDLGALDPVLESGVGKGLSLPSSQAAPKPRSHRGHLQPLCIARAATFNLE
jgi:hypothetical protein